MFIYMKIKLLSNGNNAVQWLVIPVQVGAVERFPSLQLIVAEPSKVYPELQIAV